MKISVIICAHNPRKDYLDRVLDALKDQTLPKDDWELLLVDNGSRQHLSTVWDLAWHPNARHIREEELGLTPARLRGIHESNAALLVFVDDDNVLASDYLEVSLRIADQFPHVGAFNGSTKGEYEIPIPGHLASQVNELGDFVVERDSWSNLPCRSVATPVGAGMCIRRTIAEDYAEKTHNTPLRKQLDRSGTFLLSGGDLDLAWCAIDCGLGTGRFKALSLLHLIPAERINDEYIVRLYAGYAASSVLLAAIRPTFFPSAMSVCKTECRFIIDYFRVSKIQRKILAASRRSRRQAREMVRVVADH